MELKKYNKYKIYHKTKKKKIFFKKFYNKKNIYIHQMALKKIYNKYKI